VSEREAKPPRRPRLVVEHDLTRPDQTTEEESPSFGWGWPQFHHPDPVIELRTKELEGASNIRDRRGVVATN